MNRPGQTLDDDDRATRTRPPPGDEVLSGGAARGTHWPTVALVMAAGVLAAMQVGKVPPVVPQIMAEFGIGPVTAGLVISAFLAASALLGFVGGIVGDRVGHRRYLLAGLACLAVAGAAGGVAPGVAVLLATRVLEGFGFLAVVVAAPSIIAAVSTRAGDARVALGIWGAYMPVGIALMMVATPALASAVGWRGVWFLNAVLAAAYLAVAWRLLRVPAAAIGGGGTSLADVRAALARPGPWLLAGCFALYATQFIGVTSWLPSFFTESAGFTVGRAAAVTAGVVVLNAVGNTLGGWLLRFVPRPAMLAASAAALGTLAAVLFEPGRSTPAAIALAAAFSLVGGLIPAAALTGAPVYAPSARQIGVTSGVIAQGANVGSLLGPPLLAAAVAQAGGWAGARWILAALAGGGIVLAALLYATDRRRRSDSGSHG